MSIEEDYNPPIAGVALQVPLVSGEKGVLDSMRSAITSYQDGANAPIMSVTAAKMMFAQFLRTAQTHL